jgi:hypothetical protein
MTTQQETMVKTKLTIAAAAALAAACPAAASATTIIFSLTGDYSADWSFTDETMPESGSAQGFTFQRVEGTFPGTTLGDAYIDFFSADNGGGLSIFDADGPDLLATLIGPQLYKGAYPTPTWKEGTFSFTGDHGVGSYTLAVSVVPEAGTWMLMIAGMGMVGGAMRRRRMRTTVRYA